MNKQIVEIKVNDWQFRAPNTEWVSALECGKVLHFTNLPFPLSSDDKKLLNQEILSPKSRNISLDAKGELKGAAGNEATLSDLSKLMRRYRINANSLINSLAPKYQSNLHVGPTSYRPMEVESRQQSIRADDRRLHFDAFPTRPNYGERILRVFINLNPNAKPRVWRVGESFEVAAERFLINAKPYSLWQAKVLNKLKITKSLRSEYDHLMLQLHDKMKSDLDYQKNSDQITMPFPSSSVWVCFSDQASHAVMSGQYMMEQTYNLPVQSQYDPNTSPLARLQKLTNRTLINSEFK